MLSMAFKSWKSSIVVPNNTWGVIAIISISPASICKSIPDAIGGAARRDGISLPGIERWQPRWKKRMSPQCPLIVISDESANSQHSLLECHISPPPPSLPKTQPCWPPTSLSPSSQSPFSWGPQRRGRTNASKICFHMPRLSSQNKIFMTAWRFVFLREGLKDPIDSPENAPNS